MSKSLQQWLDEYGVSHQNPTNKKIHWIAVPIIYFTVVALLWCLPTPWSRESYLGLNWALLALIPTMLFYARLSLPLMIGMLLISVLMCGLLIAYLAFVPFPLAYTAIIIFIVAWIFQFIGHHIEGKKPSFFKDLQFLLIGPLWVMHFLYRRWHWKV
jgi:uncharacterized membrane protein YGL010W